MANTNRDAQSVSALAGAAYALPVVPVLILMSTNNVLSGLYATHYGLALSAISMVMLIAGLYVMRRILDFFVRHLLGEEPPKDFDLRASNNADGEQ